MSEGSGVMSLTQAERMRFKYAFPRNMAIGDFVDSVREVATDLIRVELIDIREATLPNEGVPKDLDVMRALVGFEHDEKYVGRLVATFDFSRCLLGLPCARDQWPGSRMAGG